MASSYLEFPLDTKAMMERILTDVQFANPEMSVTLLRYFNPIGAHDTPSSLSSPVATFIIYGIKLFGIPFGFSPINPDSCAPIGLK